jgi:hypothetical protein
VGQVADYDKRRASSGSQVSAEGSEKLDSRGKCYM